MTKITDHRPPLLRKLDGNWMATGDVMGKPVRYHAAAAPALQGQFTELSMNDVQLPLQYEARIFIGFDSDSNTVIAHWMDSFGAKYSIPHGAGIISDNVIEFVVPYATGPFRDRFEYRPESDTWTLAITGKNPNGGWDHFAKYTFTRSQ